MSVEVRVAKLEDAEEITQVHCSDIQKWYRKVDNEKIETNYEDLDIVERWSHGGPWMSIETCSIQINHLLVNDQFPLVAELKGRIVGELELYIGKEKGFLGKCAYIDV